MNPVFNPPATNLQIPLVNQVAPAIVEPFKPENILLEFFTKKLGFLFDPADPHLQEKFQNISLENLKKTLAEFVQWKECYQITKESIEIGSLILKKIFAEIECKIYNTPLENLTIDYEHFFKFFETYQNDFRLFLKDEMEVVIGHVKYSRIVLIYKFQEFFRDCTFDEFFEHLTKGFPELLKNPCKERTIEVFKAEMIGNVYDIDQAHVDELWLNPEEAIECLSFYSKYLINDPILEYLNFSNIKTFEELVSIFKIIKNDVSVDIKCLIPLINKFCPDIIIKKNTVSFSKISPQSLQVIASLAGQSLIFKCSAEQPVDAIHLKEWLMHLKDHSLLCLDLSNFRDLDEDVLGSISQIKSINRLILPYEVLEFKSSALENLLEKKLTELILVPRAPYSTKNCEYKGQYSYKIILDLTQCVDASETFMKDLAEKLSLIKSLILPIKPEWEKFDFIQHWQHLKTITITCNSKTLLSENLIQAIYYSLSHKKVDLNFAFSDQSPLRICQEASNESLIAYYGCLESYFEKNNCTNLHLLDTDRVLTAAEFECLSHFPLLAILTFWTREEEILLDSSALSDDVKRRYLQACEKGFMQVGEALIPSQKIHKNLESFFSSSEDFASAPLLAKRLWKLENKRYSEPQRTYLKDEIKKLISNSQEWDEFYYDEAHQFFDENFVDWVEEISRHDIQSLPKTAEKFMKVIRLMDSYSFKNQIVAKSKERVWVIFKSCLDHSMFMKEFLSDTNHLYENFKSELLDYFAHNPEIISQFPGLIKGILLDPNLVKSDEDILHLLKIKADALSQIFNKHEIKRALKIFNQQIIFQEKPDVYIYWMPQFLQYSFDHFDSEEQNAWENCVLNLLNAQSLSSLTNKTKEQLNVISEHLLSTVDCAYLANFLFKNKYIFAKLPSCGHFFNHLLNQLLEKNEQELWFKLFNFAFENHKTLIKQLPSNQNLVNKIFDLYHHKMALEDPIVLCFFKGILSLQPSEKQLQWCYKILETLDYSKLKEVLPFTLNFPATQKIVLKKFKDLQIFSPLNPEQISELRKYSYQIHRDNYKYLFKIFEKSPLMFIRKTLNEEEVQWILNLSKEFLEKQENPLYQNNLQIAQFLISYYPLCTKPSNVEVNNFIKLINLFEKSQHNTHLKHYLDRFNIITSKLMPQEKRQFFTYAQMFLSLVNDNSINEFLMMVVSFNMERFVEMSPVTLHEKKDEWIPFIQACIILAKYQNINERVGLKIIFAKNPVICGWALDLLKEEDLKYRSHFFAFIAAAALGAPLSEMQQDKCYHILLQMGKNSSVVEFSHFFKFMTFDPSNAHFFKHWTKYIESITNEEKLLKNHVFAWVRRLCLDNFYGDYKPVLLKVIAQSHSFPDYVASLLKTDKLSDEDRTEILSVSSELQRAYYQESLLNINIDYFKRFAGLKPAEVMVPEEAQALDIEKEFLSLFDRLNTTNPQQSDFVNIQSYFTDKIKSINLLRESLKGLLGNIKRCKKIEGTPDDPEERKKYYKEIEDLLKASLHYLKNVPFNQTIDYILLLAQSGDACSDPYRNAAIALYNTFSPQLMTEENFTFEDKLHSIIRDFAWKCVYKIIKDKKEFTNTHRFTALQIFFETLLGSRPGMILNSNDPFVNKILTLEMTPPIKEQLKNQFWVHFTNSGLIDHVIQHFRNKGASFCWTTEDLTYWADGHKLENELFWTEDYTAPSRSGILLILEKLGFLKK